METIEYKGQKITIDYDMHKYDPRESEQLGTMACNYGRYNLGDEKLGYCGECFKSDLLDHLGITESELMKDYIYLPLYVYDHSGISMNTGGYDCGWDSGQVGYIYVSREDARKYYNVKKINTDEVIKHLESEVKEYDQYLRGEVYMFKTSMGESWFTGFYSESSAIKEAKEEIDNELKIQLKKHIMYIKGCIKSGVNILYRNQLGNI